MKQNTCELNTSGSYGITTGSCVSWAVMTLFSFSHMCVLIGDRRASVSTVVNHYLVLVKLEELKETSSSGLGESNIMHLSTILPFMLLIAM